MSYPEIVIACFLAALVAIVYIERRFDSQRAKVLVEIIQVQLHKIKDLENRLMVKSWQEYTEVTRAAESEPSAVPSNSLENYTDRLMETLLDGTEDDLDLPRVD